MTIASQYAVLSKDGKSLILPEDIQKWLSAGDRFVVVIENDGLILKKAHTRRTLEEVVTREKSPLSDEKFLSCALAANVEIPVSGDKHLLGLKQYKFVRILTAREFYKENIHKVT